MTEQKTLRCAVYTRKSTEYGLEQDFNSLDAQRESCEAYIKSQSHERWKLLPAYYDDGGISGATLERPALQTLLADIKARKVDIIVVYKVDRLTRSLADFAKLVELFDGHGVSFVSVTQQFNTTSSMGRLTLNVLLSFAQFEREVTAERIRDKVAASKQKGIWTGGGVPLGYINRDKKLFIDEQEAKQVCHIFQRYLKLPGLNDLKAELDAKGVVTKRKVQSNGNVRGGIPYYLGPLCYLLKNRVYVGEVEHNGKIYPGQQQAIIDRKLFDAVQAKLASNAVNHKRKRAASNAILMGKIFDDAGNRMTPTSTQKGALSYRFYLSAPWKGKNVATGSRARISAPSLEQEVLNVVHGKRASGNGTSDRQVIEEHLRKVIIHKDNIAIHLTAAEGDSDDEIVSVSNTEKRRARREIIASGEVVNDPSIGLRSENHKILVTAIAKGRRWADELLSGRSADTQKIAAREKCSERYIRDSLSLAHLSPDIVAAAVANRLPPHLIVTKLRMDVPMSWAEQRRRFHLS
jgi:site-specific DNA recombinase